jgi:diguanylate cyclase (GGDEF)-like protein/PAS domain S-box-containing protein
MLPSAPSRISLLLEGEHSSPRPSDDVVVPRHVLDRLGQGLCVFDGQNRLTLFNRRYAELYQIDISDLRHGMSLAEVVELRVRAGTGPAMSAKAYTGWRDEVALEGRVLESVVHLQNGRAIEIHHEPMPDGGWVATHEDVTDRLMAATELAASEARLRAITDSLPQIVWLTEATGTDVTYKNARFDEYYGDIGDALADRLSRNHPDDAQRMLESRQRANAAGEGYEVEGRIRRHDGAYRWHKLVLTPIRVGGSVSEWLGTALDIDEIVTAREKLQISEERLSQALDAGSDGLWEFDLSRGGGTWFSERWWRMLGYEPGDLNVTPQTWRRLLHPADRTMVLAKLTDHLAGRTAVFECEHRLLRKDGTWGWVLTRGKVVARNAAGKPTRIVGTDIDIEARKAAEHKIAHMARHDGLTDLPNRALFRERLDQRLAELGQRPGTCAVLCLDLDGFKAVNDKHGHGVGDALLREVAHRLRSTLRSDATVARFGGDEFAVILNASAPHQIATVAKRLIKAVSAPVTIDGPPMEVGVSIGIALAPRDGSDVDTLLKRADLALYRAKAEGKDTYRFYEPVMDETRAERRILEVDLRRAVHDGSLTLYFQPQVRSGQGDLIGFEALARWHHPSRGMISPADFIPLAEETGLILPLGAWVLRKACEEAARWPETLKVAVNLSAQQIVQPGLPELVLSVLTESGLSPRRLELEVTETVIINDMTRALSTLRRLKGLGVAIAMDDFGTGYSSLATLQAFPFDKIKIDRSFVGQVMKSREAAVITRAVIGLGHSLGIGVVAEGVETSGQMAFLQEEACTEFQGFLFGRPQAIEHFTAQIYGTAPSPPATEEVRPLPRAASNRHD